MKKFLKFRDFLIVTMLLLLIFMSSCVTNKKLTYLQESKVEIAPMEDGLDLTYKIHPSDNLFIRVRTPDPRWSEMFNTLPVSATTMSVGPQAVDLLSFPVRQNGTVDLPYIGNVYVEGKTLTEVKDILEKTLGDYVADAAVTVKLVNNYVSILGDVRLPGRYPIYKEHLNIFQALAMAGDVADFGDRYHIQLIRQTSDGPVVNEFDLTNKSILESEYYYVLPNDVIYAKPMKGRFFGWATFPYAVLISTITAGILLYSVIQP